MKLSEVVSIDTLFQPSINLEQDLNNEQYLQGFVPTKPILDILEWLSFPILNVNQNAFRAHLLTGSYGKGKSYAVLSELALFSGTISKGERRHLLAKIRMVRPDFASFVDENKDKKYLPVVIRGGYDSLCTAFGAGLAEAIKRRDLPINDLNTSFEKAIKVIELWQKEYPNTYTKFCSSIKDIEQFKRNLSVFDKTTFEEFRNLYPLMTSGGTFSPFSGLEIVESYRSVANDIHGLGYSGLFVVYDEFSKYLESHRSNISESDIRLLQDMAELANSSYATQSQIHLLLISHKNPENYFSDQITNKEWEAISGRYDQKELFGEDNQSYEIISQMIRIDDKDTVNTFLREHQEAYVSLEQFLLSHHLCTGNDFKWIRSCFPLQPLTTYALPRVSEKIAQNERTLFTFLCSSDKGSVKDFIESSENISLMSLDFVYDYFLPLFRKLPYNHQLFILQKRVTEILQVLANDDNFPAIKFLVKVLAVINVIDETELLNPTLETVFAAAQMTNIGPQQLSTALDVLIQNHYVTVSKLKNNILFLEDTHDILAEIKAEQLSVSRKFDLCKALNSEYKNYAFFPMRYNDEESITRYFKLIFVEENLQHNPTQIIEDYYPDGTMFAVITQNKEHYEACRNELLKKNNSCPICFYILSSTVNYERIVETTTELLAIKRCKDKHSSNQSSEMDELLSFLESDTSAELEHLLDYALRPYQDGVTIIRDGKLEFISKTRKEFSDYLSDICDKVFSHYPIINKEDLNLQNPSSIALSSRNAVIDKMLTDECDVFAFKPTSPEASFVRTVLQNTGLITKGKQDVGKNYASCLFSLEGDTPQIQEVIHQIQHFINDAMTEPQSFGLLYEILQNPCHGFGLKRGVIPLLFVSVLQKYRTYVVLTMNGNEMSLHGETFNTIEKDPDAFSLSIEEWTKEEAEYIDGLTELFGVANKSSNILFDLAKSMVQWNESLAIGVKNGKGYLNGINPFCYNLFDASTKKFMNSISFCGDKVWLYFFKKLPHIYGLSISLELVESIKQSKRIIDFSLTSSIIKLKEYLIESIEGVASKMISPSLYNWFDNQTISTTHLYSNRAKALNILLKKRTLSDDSLFQQITTVVAGIRIEDWQEQNYRDFIEGWRAYISEIEGAEKEEIVQSDKSQSVLELSGPQGIKRIRIGEIHDSKMMQMAENEIHGQLNEYSESLSEEEKRQILLKLLLSI